MPAAPLRGTGLEGVGRPSPLPGAGSHHSPELPLALIKLSYRKRFAGTRWVTVRPLDSCPQIKLINPAAPSLQPGGRRE